MFEKKFSILFVVIVVLALSVAVVGGFYGNAIEKIDDLENELADMQVVIGDLNTSAVAFEAEVSALKNFTNNYFMSWGLYYQAKEGEDQAWYNFNRAENYYDDGNWFIGVGFYGEAAKFFRSVQSEYDAVSEAFDVAANTSNNMTVQLICEGYADMVDCLMRGMSYQAEASDLMESVCSYYLDGDFSSAHSLYDEAQTKIGLYEGQLALYDELEEDVEALWYNYAMS